VLLQISLSFPPFPPVLLDFPPRFPPLLPPKFSPPFHHFCIYSSFLEKSSASTRCSVKRRTSSSFFLSDSLHKHLPPPGTRPNAWFLRLAFYPSTDPAPGIRFWPASISLCSHTLDSWQFLGKENVPPPTPQWCGPETPLPPHFLTLRSEGLSSMVSPHIFSVNFFFAPPIPYRGRPPSETALALPRLRLGIVITSSPAK